MTVLTRAIARMLFLPTLLAAFAVLVKGYTATGDGFSAGVIAALAVLLQYLAFDYQVTQRMLPVRWAPGIGVAGLLLALVVAFAPLLLGEPLVTHFPRPGTKVVHLGKLELLTAVVFDVGMFLLVWGFSVHVMNMLARGKWGVR